MKEKNRGGWSNMTNWKWLHIRLPIIGPKITYPSIIRQMLIEKLLHFFVSHIFGIFQFFHCGSWTCTSHHGDHWRLHLEVKLLKYANNKVNKDIVHGPNGPIHAYTMNTKLVHWLSMQVT
jgi:hypothetical protein